MVVIGLLAVSDPLPLSAGGGTTMSVPLTGRKMTSGVRLTIDNRWVEGNGYRPLRLTLSTAPLVPAKADRGFEIVLGFMGQRGPMQTPEVTTFMELPQGATTASITVPVPYNDDWFWTTTEVYENGRLLTDLSEQNLSGVRRLNHMHSEAIPRVLVVHSAAPDLRTRQISPVASVIPLDRTLPDLRPLLHLLATLDRYGNVSALIPTDEKISDVEILNTLYTNPWLELLSPTDLPTEWISLSCLDIVVLQRDAIPSISPESLDAIKCWMYAGGILCLTGAGPDFARLNDYELQFALAPLTTKESTSPASGWSLPDVKLFGGQPLLELTSNRNNSGVASVANTTTSVASTPMPPPAESPFAWRRAGLGHLVAFAKEDPFEHAQPIWNWLLDSVPKDNWMWFRRNGMSLQRNNREYGNWLIPDIGKAPVFAFLVMISVFVIVIGPINHFVLSRKRRLILLLVTVPLGAGVVTIGLFGYALFHDGLETRARLRSYTHIDQRIGHVISLSRQTYYAGISPSGGLVFPRDSTVYQVEHEHFRSYARRPSPYAITMGEKQVLRRGYVASRTMAQFMVTRSAPTTAQLEIDESPDSPPTITNRLGTQLQELLLRDGEGRYFHGQSIVEGDRATLQAINLGSATDAFQAILRDHIPDYPEGFEPDRSTASPWFSVGPRNWGSAADASLPDPSFRFGLMERNLRRTLLSENKLQLEPNSYVAVVPSSPEVPLGVARLREQASLHVIEGHW